MDEDTPVSPPQCPFPPKRSALDAHTLRKECGEIKDDQGGSSPPFSTTPSFVASKSLQVLPPPLTPHNALTRWRLLTADLYHLVS